MMFSVRWVIHYCELEPIKIENFIQGELDELVSSCIRRLHILRLWQVPRPPDGFLVTDAAGREVRRWFASSRSDTLRTRNGLKLLRSDWDRDRANMERKNNFPITRGFHPVPAGVNYIVVPFVARDGKLAPGSPQLFQNADRAKRTAVALGAVKAGVIVLREKATAESDNADEPRIIWHHGKIPAELFRFI